MDYLKAYENLIQTRTQTRNFKKESGYEVHHILPRCLGGDDFPNNLVKLTYREHYIAHWLLIKIYPDEPKIHYGFLCMLRDPWGERKLTSRMVDTIKNNYSQFKKWHTKIVNPMDSLEARKKASDRIKGANNPMVKFPEKNPFLGKSYVIGRKWYNNGVENKYLFDNEQIPEGFIKGMVYKPRKKSEG